MPKFFLVKLQAAAYCFIRQNSSTDGSPEHFAELCRILKNCYFSRKYVVVITENIWVGFEDINIVSSSPKTLLNVFSLFSTHLSKQISGGLGDDT